MQRKMLLVILANVLAFYVIQANSFESCVRRGPPGMIRVAIRKPNEITISWQTFGYLEVPGWPPVIENDMKYPQVEYSTSPTFSSKVVTPIGTSTTYGPSYYRSWYHNCVLIVKPSTRYYYRIPGAAPCVTTSANHSFVSPPVFGSSNPMNITIVGDLGNNKDKNNNSATKTIRALFEAASSTDLFLHLGDISYADDPEIYPFQWYEEAWNVFQENMEPITADNIYMTVPGNHEVTCNQAGDFLCVNAPFSEHYRNFSAYLNRFRMPGNESGGYSNLWFSFDMGLVHVVVINTETDFDDAPAGPNTLLNGGNFQPNGTQIAWLKADLKKARENRHNVPWIIVAGHRPFYGSAPNYTIPMNHSDNCDSCRDAFGQILFDNDVDFYFCGHVHWQERLFPVNGDGEPVAKDYNNRKGVIHVTSGAGGAAEGANTLNATGVALASAKIISAYGYTRLEIIHSSYCRLSFFNSVTNRTEDSVDIFRFHD